MSLISARTAEKIKQLANKGQDYINIIIKLCPLIETGRLGHNKLAEKVYGLLQKTETVVKESTQVFGKDKRHLYTWRKRQ